MAGRFPNKKRPIMRECRHCKCTITKSCRIVTQRGTRDCQWYGEGLCDNPQCLIAEAQLLEKPRPDMAKAASLRERADWIRRQG